MLDYGKQAQWDNGFGGQQSPIALNTEEMQATKNDKCLLSWQPDITGVSLSDMGINFQLNGTGQAQLEQRPYTFQQLHFHTPAEHVIDDQQAVMEWHFAFKDVVGQLAVVARMAQLGEANPILEALLQQFQPATTVELKQSLPLQAVLPTQGPIIRYLGSLTTPPLTEGVRWYLDQTPLTISADQLARYQQFFPQQNNRDLQDRHDRPILKTII